MTILSDIYITRLNRSILVRAIITITKVIGYLLPFRNRSGLFFFFPFCHIGGAEKVHSDIVECFSSEKPWVFFTKKSNNEKFRAFFYAGRTFNAWLFCKYGYPFSIGIMAGFINRHRQPVVFGSNSLFYYLLLPYLRPDIRKVDLLHAFGAGIEEYSLATAPLLNKRVVINKKTGQELNQQYHDNYMPEELNKKILYIGNRVAIPDSLPLKNNRTALTLLYVGRGSEEKRVHLIGRLATKCHRMGFPVDIFLAGQVAEAVAPEDHSSCCFLGEIHDQAQMSRFYEKADVLLLTSSREGFPLVIMEAMAHGVVPLSTSVGGISEHVINGVNGWLVENHDDEERIVGEMCAIVGQMCTDRQLLASMSHAVYDYACKHFSGEQFCISWRQLLGKGGGNA
jgi:L-malate glycosyltransferase